jgi:hypothetical protein
MQIDLKRKAKVYVLPDEFAGYQVMVVDGRHHLARIDAPGYSDPPVCGQSTASGNFKRCRDFATPEIFIHTQCVKIARGEESAP